MADNSVSVLLDTAAPFEERENAAMDLSEHRSSDAIDALLTVGSNPDEDEMLHASCGESLAEIWSNMGEYNYMAWLALCPRAKDEFLNIVQEEQPDWISESGELLEPNLN